MGKKYVYLKPYLDGQSYNDLEMVLIQEFIVKELNSGRIKNQYVYNRLNSSIDDKDIEKILKDGSEKSFDRNNPKIKVSGSAEERFVFIGDKLIYSTRWEK